MTALLCALALCAAGIFCVAGSAHAASLVLLGLGLIGVGAANASALSLLAE
jgi:hypothetical protein